MSPSKKADILRIYKLLLETKSQIYTKIYINTILSDFISYGLPHQRAEAIALRQKFDKKYHFRFAIPSTQLSPSGARPLHNGNHSSLFLYNDSEFDFIPTDSTWINKLPN